MAFIEKQFGANAPDITGAANDENFHAPGKCGAIHARSKRADDNRRKPLKRPGSGSSREHQPNLALMIVPEFYVAEAAVPESSVVQCGQRVALLGIDIWQAGQSFVTGGA